MLEYAVNNWEAKCVCRQQINPAPCQVCLSPLDSLCSRKCPPSGLHTLPPPWSVRMPRVARRRAYLRSVSLSLSLSLAIPSLYMRSCACLPELDLPSRVGSKFRNRSQRARPCSQTRRQRILYSSHRTDEQMQQYQYAAIIVAVGSGVRYVAAHWLVP